MNNGDRLSSAARGLLAAAAVADEIASAGGSAFPANWDAIADRAADIVPAYGFVQAEREVASAKEHR